MLDETLAAAFIDGGLRRRVLGKRLRPFSLWHRLLLQTIDSPFLRKGEVRLFDLRTAVGICRLEFPDSKVVRPLPLLGVRLREQVDQFLLYAGDYLARPEYAIIPPETKTPPPSRGQPPEVMLVVGEIIGWSGWPPSLVWNLPIGQAYWYQMLAQRHRGADVDFLTKEEREFQGELKAREEHAR